MVEFIGYFDNLTRDYLLIGLIASQVYTFYKLWKIKRAFRLTADFILAVRDVVADIEARLK